MKLPRLYALSDERVVPPGEIVERTEALLEAGVRMFQVRFKRLPPRERIRRGRALRELTARYGALLIANDSPELARGIGADGVHLGREDPSPGRARRILGKEAVLGVTGYADRRRIARFTAGTVDYLGISSPHPSPTKSKPCPSPEAFRALVAAARVPVYAVGASPRTAPRPSSRPAVTAWP